MGKAVSLLLVPLAFAAACSNPSGDQPANVTPNALGAGVRIRDIANPNSPKHPMDVEPSGPHPQVNVSGAVVLWIDNYDETHDGKSRGTIYIQDVGSQDPYSGLSVFSPSWVPADLRVAPGDVLDFGGPYEELPNVGSAKFPAGQVLVQLAKPVGTFRYEYKEADPAVIDPTDLNDYAKGRQWLNMLVTVKNVSVPDGLTDDGKGRVTGPITADRTANGVAVSNELMTIVASDPTKNVMGDYPPGTKFASVTGIVTWFFSYHIAPRTKDDLVVMK